MSFKKFLNLDEIKARVNIYDVISKVIALEPNTGGNFIGLCPFHTDTKPSFIVNPQQGLFFCHACPSINGKVSHGDVVDFVKRYYKLDTRQALELLDSDHIGHGPADAPIQPPKPVKKKSLKLVEASQVMECVPLFVDSGLYQYAKIKGVFDLERLLTIAKLYRIGAKDKAKKEPFFRWVNCITFPFYWLNTSDKNDLPKCVALEHVGYSNTGKRKDVDYIYNITGTEKSNGAIGLHLIHPKALEHYKLNIHTINIVESGKTALLMQALEGQNNHVLNGTLWLATGGARFLNNLLKTLKELDLTQTKTVNIYPDANDFKDWDNVANMYGLTVENPLNFGATGKQDILDSTLVQVLTSRVKDAPLEQATILRPHPHKRKIQDKKRTQRINAIKTAIKQQNEANDTSGANEGFLTPYA